MSRTVPAASKPLNCPTLIPVLELGNLILQIKKLRAEPEFNMRGGSGSKSHHDATLSLNVSKIKF